MSVWLIVCAKAQWTLYEKYQTSVHVKNDFDKQKQVCLSLNSQLNDSKKYTEYETRVMNIEKDIQTLQTQKDTITHRICTYDNYVATTVSWNALFHDVQNNLEKWEDYNTYMSHKYKLRRNSIQTLMRN